MQESVQEITASYPSKIRLIQRYPQIIHQMSYKAVGKKECVADSYIANVNLDAMFDVGEKLNIDQLLKVSSIAKNEWVTIDISGNRDKSDIHQAPPNQEKSRFKMTWVYTHNDLNVCVLGCLFNVMIVIDDITNTTKVRTLASLLKEEIDR